MTEWAVNKHDHHWLVWEEQLAPDRWLVCFKPSPQSQLGAVYWINVMLEQWSTQRHCPKVIEEYTLDDALVQACVMYEMRDKYGEPHANV